MKNTRVSFWKRYKGIVMVALMVVLVGCGTASNEQRTSTGLTIAIALITFVVALGAGAVPLLGIKDRENLLRWATGLAAGFLFSSVLLVAIPEGFEMVFHAELELQARHDADTPLMAENGESHAEAEHSGVELFGFKLHQLAGASLLLGFLLMLILESMGFGHDLHEEHHHEAADGGHVHHPTVPPDPRHGLSKTIVIGLSVHALADGLAIGAALATGSLALTIPLMLGMVMHKMPAAFSLAAFSQHTHGNVQRSWRELVTFSLATPVALIIAHSILGGVQKHWLGFAILVSAGTFLYVAAVDVLPNVIHNGSRKLVILQVSIGTVIIAALLLSLDALGLASHVH